MEKKYKVFQWISLYCVDVIVENLTLDEANELADSLRKEDGRCNAHYIVE
jgi:hypothetical protein